MKNGFRVFDVDFHSVEPIDLWTRNMPERFRDLVSIGAPGKDGVLETSNFAMKVGDTINFNLRQPMIVSQSLARWKEEPHLGAVNASYTHDLVRAGMAAEGIDLCAVFPTITFAVTSCDQLPPDVALAICRVYNDWIGKWIRDSGMSNRIHFWAWLPRQAPDLAAEELRRCVHEYGAIGAGITTGGVDGRLLTEASFDPLWAAAQALDVPVGIHIYGAAPAMKDETNRRYWGRENATAPQAIMNGVFHAMSSVPELIFGRVFERFPKLRVGIMEAGASWLLWLVDRMDEKAEIYEGHYPPLQRTPKEYFLDHIWVTVDADEPAVRYLFEEGLGRNLLFTTDYPHHDAPYPHGVENFLGQRMSDDAKRMVLWENTLSFLGWSKDRIAAVNALPSLA